MPIFIQSIKLTSILKFSARILAICVLGGEPMSVPTPPILAAYAMDNIKKTLNLDCRCAGGMASTTAIAIGSIMSAVAVLEIHMEMRPVLKIKPNRILDFLSPTIAIMRRAICS